MHTAIQFHSGIRWFSCGTVLKIMTEIRMKHFYSWRIWPTSL